MQCRLEQAEVILSNLLALQHPLESKFIIEHDDIVVTLQTALRLLVEHEKVQCR